MKKIFSFIFCLFLIFALLGCGDTGSSSNGSQDTPSTQEPSNNEPTPETDGFKLTSNIECEISENKINIRVCSDVFTYSFINAFSISSNYNWNLYSDLSCISDSNIVSKTVSLNNEESIYYALFTNVHNENDMHLFTINILRKCDYIENTLKNPTCTEKGRVSFTCKKNANHYYEKEISELGHSPVKDNYKEPTCNEVGLTEGKHCSVCGEIIVGQDEITMKEHNFIEGICTCGKDTSILLTYELLSDNTYEVVSGKNIKDIIIPSKYNGLPVTSIGQNAFKNSSVLESVKIPSSIEKIGFKAFYGCNKLTKVVFEDGDGSLDLGTETFENCIALESIHLPKQLYNMGIYDFMGCSSLKSISVSSENKIYYGKDGVLYRDDSVYYRSSSYGIRVMCYPQAKTEKSLVVDNCECIHDGAFYGSKIETVTIYPKKSTFWIGPIAFSNTNLKYLYYYGGQGTIALGSNALPSTTQIIYK